MWCDVMCKKVCWKNNEWIRNEVLSHCSQVLHLTWFDLYWLVLCWSFNVDGLCYLLIVSIVCMIQLADWWLMIDEWWMDRSIETKSKMRSLFSSQATSASEQASSLSFFVVLNASCRVLLLRAIGWGDVFQTEGGSTRQERSHFLLALVPLVPLWSRYFQTTLYFVVYRTYIIG